MRKSRLFLIVMLVGFLGALGFPSGVTKLTDGQSLGLSTAHAQQAKSKKRRSLMSILFGRKKAKKKTVTVKKRKRRASSSSRNRSKKRKKSRRSSRKLASGAGSLPKKKKVEKLEDAKVILVVGDFFAGGLADGLVNSFSDVATLRVVDKTKGLSGFVRDDVIDWPAQLPKIVAETNPSYIVAMLGSNDRQQMRHEGKKLSKRTEEWDAAYKGRVKALGDALKATGVSYNWVGLPPVRFKSMNKDFLIFNEWYGNAAASPNGSFIDIWDGFSDADGNYSRSGPDVNGQIVLLRNKDGINLSRAGKQRLAYYVEGLITKKLGGTTDVASSVTGLEIENVVPKEAEYDPAKTGKTIVVRLDDPSADGGDLLAGEKIEIKPAVSVVPAIPTTQTTAVSTFRQGRADNFTWPPQNGLPQSGDAVVAGGSN